MAYSKHLWRPRLGFRHTEHNPPYQTASGRPMILMIPHRQLSPEALQGLIEEFVTREGTDYGEREIPVPLKVEQLRHQLDLGTSLILYDTNDSRTTIVPSERLPPELKDGAYA